MRLLDSVAHQRPFHVENEALGLRFRVQTAADFQSRIESTPHRFVLDAKATAFCAEFAIAEATLLSESVDLLRCPAERFWIEWMDRARVEALAPHIPSLPNLEQLNNDARSGALVELSPGGRRGKAWLFTGYGSDADLCPLYVEFDLERPAVAPARDPYLKQFSVSCLELPKLDLINRHCLMAVEPSWFTYCKFSTPSAKVFNDVVTQLASKMLFDWPFIAAFTLLYQIPNLLDRRVSNLIKLNASRTRRGKPELLEHVEIGASLIGRLERLPAEDTRAVSAKPRTRLHHVRGHLVRRGDSIFWRSPHLRGDPALGMVKTRTVRFTA